MYKVALKKNIGATEREGLKSSNVEAYFNHSYLFSTRGNNAEIIIKSLGQDEGPVPIHILVLYMLYSSLMFQRPEPHAST